MATLREIGQLKGHNGWVTALAPTVCEGRELLLSASRDKTVIVWSLTPDNQESYGYAKRALRGHNHFVSDVTASHDGKWALSGSWDGTLRLWEIETGKCTERFTGHTNDVMSVAFSSDNRMIVSSSRDKSINVWNTVGSCMASLKNSHEGWVSSVRFSPAEKSTVMVSVGWDNVVNVWNAENGAVIYKLEGHTGYVTEVTISPDGSLCASAGKDGSVMLWDISEGKRLYTLDGSDEIHALAFSPSEYWLCASTVGGIKIWDLQKKTVLAEVKIENPYTGKNAQAPYCGCLAWSAKGTEVFAGCTDNVIRVYRCVE